MKHLPILCSLFSFPIAKSYIGDFGENTLWYTTAFSSNSSSLSPVFSTNTELSSTSFTELMSIAEFLSTSELLSTGGLEETPVRLG